MTIGKRLREERERFGLSQPAFAALAKTTKQTLFSWESEKTAPDGFQFAAFAAAGVDVLYVLTGTKTPQVTIPPDQQVLLSSYERCQPEAKQHLIQTAALLSAGMPVSHQTTTPRKQAATKKTEKTPPSVNMTNHAVGGVQIGVASNKVRTKVVTQPKE